MCTLKIPRIKDAMREKCKMKQKRERQREREKNIRRIRKEMFVCWKITQNAKDWMKTNNTKNIEENEVKNKCIVKRFTKTKRKKWIVFVTI